MPELPEVQSTLNGLLDFVPKNKINKILIHFPTLRYPIPKNIVSDWINKYILNIERYAKYLFFLYWFLLNASLPPKTNIGPELKISSQSPVFSPFSFLTLISDSLFFTHT